MAYADSIRTKTAGMNDVASLIEGIVSSGFPLTWTTWVPTLTGFSANPAGAIYKYIQIGKLVILRVDQTPAAGTSNATGFTITLPATSNCRVTGPITFTNNGAQSATPGMAEISVSGTIITLYTTWLGGLWTGSSTKSAWFSFMYEST